MNGYRFLYIPTSKYIIFHTNYYFKDRRTSSFVTLKIIRDWLKEDVEEKDLISSLVSVFNGNKKFFVSTEWIDLNNISIPVHDYDFILEPCEDSPLIREYT